MKRLCVTIALAGMITLPLVSMARDASETVLSDAVSLSVGAEKSIAVQKGEEISEAPVCDANAIAQYEITIKKDEYRSALMRAGVYVCAFAGISYLGYRFLTSRGAASKLDAQVVSPKELSPEKIAALELLLEKAKGSPFLSGMWFKNLFIGARDMVIQSAAVAGFFAVGDYAQKQLFYGKRISEFLVRSTDLIRMRADIEGYAAMLETSESGYCCRTEIQALLQDRTRRLCHDVERIVAYMHIVRDGVDTPSKDAFVVAEQFLVARTNAALASLWQSATNTDKKSSDLARTIALTLHMFVQDFGQAVERFDTAYYLAVYAA